MAALTCKNGVVFKAFPAAMVRMLATIYAVAKECTDVPAVVITSANDSTHSEHSQHYRDTALDLRTKNFPSEVAKAKFAARLRSALGPKFTVLYEGAGTPNEHLHCQVRKGLVYQE